MPTLAGVRDVCKAVAPSGQLVCWFNLRQEPCIYVNGSPFTVKDRDAPFLNQQHMGVLKGDVEHAEVLLKLEALAEVRESRPAILGRCPC